MRFKEEGKDIMKKRGCTVPELQGERETNQESLGFTLILSGKKTKQNKKTDTNQGITSQQTGSWPSEPKERDQHSMCRAQHL